MAEGTELELLNVGQAFKQDIESLVDRAITQFELQSLDQMTCSCDLLQVLIIQVEGGESSDKVAVCFEGRCDVVGVVEVVPVVGAEQVEPRF